jgi:hypothetical protein
VARVPRFCYTSSAQENFRLALFYLRSSAFIGGQYRVLSFAFGKTEPALLLPGPEPIVPYVRLQWIGSVHRRDLVAALRISGEHDLDFLRGAVV